MTTDIDTDEIFTQVSARLREKFPELSAEQVESAVKIELDDLNGRPVRDYLEVLTERAAKKRLKSLVTAAAA
jgi:hypothetical protein